MSKANNSKKLAANIVGNFGFAEGNGYTGYSVEALNKDGNGINIWYFEAQKSALEVSKKLLKYDDVFDVRVCREFEDCSEIVAA